MFEYEMQQLRQADLLREAAQGRKASEARKARRSGRHAHQDGEGRVSHAARRFRFARAA
ncbi:hypothetical protein H9Y04_02995 [Streptomyces sp. TRM66268-LWL]|uniref:Uncharacterized protein n=1 Tax=Streptomyces polyasparticus TaxID=2767826 RepID=A0ABR7S977_9ACTN|nr:hypothetical protein [Streptomyces polyasparticus]MBC9711539.1 hypothetical protein [Streptomyces polyasparticus]